MIRAQRKRPVSPSSNGGDTWQERTMTLIEGLTRLARVHRSLAEDVLIISRALTGIEDRVRALEEKAGPR